MARLSICTICDFVVLAWLGLLPQENTPLFGKLAGSKVMNDAVKEGPRRPSSPALTHASLTVPFPLNGRDVSQVALPVPWLRKD